MAAGPFSNRRAGASRRDGPIPAPCHVTQPRVDDEANVGHGAEGDPAVVARAEAVAVQAGAEDEVDPIPGHYDGRETDDRAGRESEVLHPADVPCVQRDDVTEEGDQRPDLLDVPTP